MKTCPFCAEDIKDAAIVCKHCGRDLERTAPVAQAPQLTTPSAGRQLRHSRGVLRWIVIALIIGAVIGTLATKLTERAARQPNIQTLAVVADTEPSVERKMAIIQTADLNPPKALVDEIASALTSLERNCRESRSSSPGLGDFAVSGARMIRNGTGRVMSLSEFLHAMDRSIPAGRVTKRDCSDIATTLITKMGGRITP